jgi:hypothetical protein
MGRTSASNDISQFLKQSWCRGVNPISSSGWSLRFQGLPGFELKGAVAEIEVQGLGFKVYGIALRA